MELITKREKAKRQSLEFDKTHEMLIPLLDGQIYLKETFNKVNTNQVTGEALKKVSVGGKGGFGSQGDARDAAKQVDVTSRVMVLSGPSQEAFDHNASLDKIVIGWRKDNGRAIYLNNGESVVKRRFVPSHLFGSKEIKGWKEFVKSHGRDYDEFAHTAEWDASDSHRFIEFMHKENIFGHSIDVDIDSIREEYDELCGYKGAWKYVGIDGAEHRRYRFTIASEINISGEKPSLRYNGGIPSWTDEHSTSRHHRDLYGFVTANYRLNNDDPQVLKDWLVEHNNDHGYYVMWLLEQQKPEMWSPIKPIVEQKVYPANKSIKAKRVRMSPEYEAKRDRVDELTSHLYKDLKVVYRWEGTSKGKIRFLDVEKAKRPDGWKCKDRERKNRTKRYTK